MRCGGHLLGKAKGRIWHLRHLGPVRDLSWQLGALGAIFE